MRILTFLLVLLYTDVSYGQVSARDSVAQELSGYIKKVYAAAEQFLNKQLDTSERLKIIEPYTILYDEKQKQRFADVALDDREAPVIRAAALHRIHELVPENQRLQQLEDQLLGNPRSPAILRRESLHVAESLAFSSMKVPEIYQKLMDDPDTAFRIFAFTQLIVHGDAGAQQRLIQGLGEPSKAPLPASTAIEILSMAVKSEYYPAVYKVLLETKDETARLAAVRVLGPYKEARPKLIQISVDANEAEPFREAALGALYGADRDNIVTYATPILTDKSAGSRLQAIAIQMAIDVRQSMAFRTKAKKADAFDILVKNIAEGNGAVRSDELQKVAGSYIRSVKPNY
jgi:hypothetical protein